jgi:DNA-binding NarL/FixJ family response regulator
LEQQGYEICGEAEDGLQAIDSAKQLNPDLILLDVSMPKLGGPQAAPILKRLLPKTRIILFTLFVDSLGKELAEALGVDLVLSKTDGMAKLLHSVQTVMESNDSARSVFSENYGSVLPGEIH